MGQLVEIRVASVRCTSLHRDKCTQSQLWQYNALFGNCPTTADADRPDANWVRDMKATGCSHQPEIEEA